uniref:Uncharacterized protein n=1 Tax=Anguilla anguilla TaxID=7936 RepID=A0A0E9WT36_ANGAN
MGGISHLSSFQWYALNKFPMLIFLYIANNILYIFLMSKAQNDWISTLLHCKSEKVENSKFKEIL